MFCLRSWIPILFFLLRTKASPTYLIIFLVASYFLNRPCVYCSLLLFILVAALFDFHSAWFEASYSALSNTTGNSHNGTAEAVGGAGNGDLGLGTASLYAQAATQTAQALLNAAVEGVKEKFSGGSAQVDGLAGIMEWVKGVWARKEVRIPCLDVLVRL